MADRDRDNPEIPGRPGVDGLVRVSGLIHDISKLRERYFEQQCRSPGITRAQWWLMHRLSGCEPGAPSQTDLAAGRVGKDMRSAWSGCSPGGRPRGRSRSAAGPLQGQLIGAPGLRSATDHPVD